jgi:PAS domain S-box-containing protein
MSDSTDEGIGEMGEAREASIDEVTRLREALRQSECNSRLILDTIPGLVALLTPDGGVEFVNRRILEYTGRTLEELKHWGTDDTVHREDLPHVIQAFTQSIASGSPYEIVQRFRRSDGVYRWFQNSGFPLRDTGGRIVRWCVLLTDVDERKRAEDNLRARERFRVIVDDLPTMVTLMTPDGEFADGNRYMLEYFGAPLDELKRRPTTYSFHPDDRTSVDARWKESVETGRPYDHEARLRRADGTYRWFHTRGFPLRDAEGRIVLWHLLQTDVDDRKRAEDALRASERNLQLIIDTIPALAWSARPDGSGDFFSQHYLHFIGLSAEQARDWGWTSAVHPEDLEGLAATWQRILASEGPGEAVARLRRHDGHYRWFLFRANPLRDANGKIVTWYGINTDIEDQKRAEVDLRRAYDSFADAQRLSHTGNFTADVVADEHVWSEELYRIFEFDPATKITVQAVRDVIHPDDLPSFDAGLARSLTGTDFDLVFRIVTRSGKAKHVRSLARLSERMADRPLFTGAIQDVTESKIAEEALNRARFELAHVARVTTLSTLTASIAHEVNQPLSGIMTNAGTCLRMLDANPPNVEGARETARRTIRDANRASEVITRLRALFSKREFTLESLDLNEAVREVIALSLSELQRSRVVVQSELADDLPTVSGDRIQLQQVVLNLLRNASDAMIDVHNRPRQLTVKTEREKDGNRVRVIVRDTGVGLDAESADKLFDAFHTTKRDGMGIGLSVSRSIIDRHHGRLWAEPNDGPGATFVFSIPCDAESVALKPP